MWKFDLIELVGLTAAVFTTSSFAPQVYHSWKTKDVEGLSLTMYIVFFIGTLLWTVYGVSIGSMSVILANIVTSLLILVLIYLKIKYRKRL